MQPSEAELAVVAQHLGPILRAGEPVWLELTASQSVADAHAFADRLARRLGFALERAQMISEDGIALAVWKAGAVNPLDERLLISAE